MLKKQWLLHDARYICDEIPLKSAEMTWQYMNLVLLGYSFQN